MFLSIFKVNFVFIDSPSTLRNNNNIYHVNVKCLNKIFITWALAANISSIAEPAKRVAERPASKACFNFPKTAPQLAGQARGRAPQAA